MPQMLSDARAAAAPVIMAPNALQLFYNTAAEADGMGIYFHFALTIYRHRLELD